MADIRDISAQKYNASLAKALKELDEFEKPEWIALVKSGAGKVRPIDDPDFWHKRAASILRQLYIRGIVGVGRLRTRYGNRKNRGSQPARFYKGAGKAIRVILQQAEKAELVEKVKGSHSGRQLTSKGKQFLESMR